MTAMHIGLHTHVSLLCELLFINSKLSQKNN